MDAEVDSESGPCNGSPKVDETQDDRVTPSPAEASPADFRPEAHDEEDSQGQNGKGSGEEEIEEENEVEGEEEEAKENEEEEPDLEHLMEEVEADEGDDVEEEQADEVKAAEEDEAGSEEDEGEQEEDEVGKERKEEDVEQEEDEVGNEREEEDCEQEEDEVGKEREDVEQEEDEVGNEREEEDCEQEEDEVGKEKEEEDVEQEEDEVGIERVEEDGEQEEDEVGKEREEEDVEQEEDGVGNEREEEDGEQEEDGVEKEVENGDAGKDDEEAEEEQFESESEMRKEEDQDGGDVADEWMGHRADEETGEVEGDEERNIEEEEEEEEESEDVAEGQVKMEPAEMGDDYDENFLSIPVECDLQEESQDTPEKQDSGSNYSAEDAEDSRDEDYTPRARWTRSRKPRSEFDDDLPEEMSDELRDAYRLFLDITVCAGTHFLNHPSLEKGAADYMDIIDRPMWLEEMKQRFLIGEYTEVEQFVTDLKLILVNCYQYYGRDDPHTRKALKIEQWYSKKIASFPEEERRKLMLDPEETLDGEEDKEIDDHDPDDQNKAPKKKEYRSSLLERFGDENKKRREERKDALKEERKLILTDNEKQKLEWERDTLFSNGTHAEMKAMWEIPQISQILQLTRSSLCIEDIPHYEVERMFLMPQSSKLLAILMTSLLSPPISRPKLQMVPPMPYSIWSKKLAQRVAFWYKSYYQRNKDTLKAFQHLGIEEEFWPILGDWNQLEDYEFYELSFHQRVWIVKSLIDYLLHHHKTMLDSLGEHNPDDQVCTYLGEDEEGRQYLHLPIFHRGSEAVRVYRTRPIIDTWVPEIGDEPEKKAVKTTRKQTRRGGRKFGRGSAAKRKEKRKQLYDFRKLDFISRNTYRMPYSLHGGRKCRKRRGRLPETTNLNSDKPEPDVPFEENADCSPTNSPEVSQDGREFRTRTRSTRNKYQANYLDWSDSDDNGATEEPEIKPSRTRSKSAFSIISEETQNSKSDERIVGELPESCLADDATQDASLTDDGASRSSSGKVGKNSVKGDESDGDDDEDDEMPVISPTKIDEYEDDALWLTKSAGKKETRRPRHDPTLRPDPEYFELVADSVQGIRDLIDSFSDEDDMDLMHRYNNSETKSNQSAEQKLKKALSNLVVELEPIELRLEKAARLARNKMYNEWFEWRLRGEDFKDSAEIYWLSLLDPVNRAPPVLTPQIEPPIRVKIEIKKEYTGESNSVSGEVENSNAPSETTTQSEEANAEGEGRHSTRRSKRRVEPNGLCGDSFQSVWPDEMSTEEESERESDHDDSWEMPSKRRRKRTRMPKKRPVPKEGQEEGEEPAKKPKKKGNDKTAHVKKRLWGLEDGDKKSGSSTVSLNDGVHGKLTLDKQGNLFITMSSGERIPLEKDEEERIKVPDSLPKFAVLNGKTLQQLFGENRVIPKAVRRKECSTTLFPALPMPPVFPKEEKDAGGPTQKTSDGINDPNVDVKKLMANKVTIQKAKPGEQRVYPPSSKPNSSGTAKKDVDVEVIATPKKPKVDADIVYLSDGSDDSIELIQESTPTKPSTPRKRAGIPRIQKVVGNAKIDLPASVKNISKSVTMSPVLPRHVTPTKNLTPTKEYQWKPVITNSRSLNANSTRMPAPGAGPAWKGQRQVISSISPEVQITTTRKPTTQRNLSVYRTPNQAFVPVTSLSTRPAQSNFVPVNQFVPMNNQYNNANQFQPVTNQFVPVNSPHFVSLNSQSMVQVNPVTPQAPRVRMLAGNTTITPLPTPARTQPVQAQGSPTLSGQIVLVNTDKGFTYAVKLADGGTIFLTPEQVAKIREANSGKLTTMVTLHTN